MIETLGKAIQKINPGYPKMIYHFNDLYEPFTTLVSAIEAEDKTASPIWDAYIRGYQDWNEMPRPQLLRFVETTKADPELHRVFVTKLLEKNPELAAVVK
jgi:hypothetical protein